MPFLISQAKAPLKDKNMTKSKVISGSSAAISRKNSSQAASSEFHTKFPFPPAPEVSLKVKKSSCSIVNVSNQSSDSASMSSSPPVSSPSGSNSSAWSSKQSFS